MSRAAWARALVRERIAPKLLSHLEADRSGIPLYSENGRWVASAGNRWCDGFWPGILWLAWALDGDPRLRRAAEAATGALRGRDRDAFANFDVGFLFCHSFALGHRLTGIESYRAAALAASERMLACVSPTAGLITLFARAPEDRSDPRAEHSLIDVLGAQSLLWWADGEDARRRAAAVAAQQVRTAVARQLRPDGSVWQQLDFDRDSGDWIACGTRHGAHVAGCWARAQAWAVLGLLTAAEATGETALLRAGQAALDFFMARLPESGPPPWDLGPGPLAPEAGDLSSLAIVAAALAKLDGWALAVAGRDAHLERCLETLEASLAPPGEPGLLIGGSAYPRRGEGLAGATVWGDYFFLETLAHLTGGPGAVMGFPLRPAHR